MCKFILEYASKINITPKKKVNWMEKNIPLTVYLPRYVVLSIEPIQRKQLGKWATHLF